MEKRVNKLITTYITEFKENIRKRITEIEDANVNKASMAELVEYVFEYPRLVISKEELNKRKRVKNAIPGLIRCVAKRSNGEQCTRRRKDGCEFCGTHVKGTPHGLITSDTNDANSLQKLDVFAEEISGIVYYVDKYNNVYKTEDILAGVENPAIIAKCTKHGNVYTIPELGLV